MKDMKAIEIQRQFNAMYANLLVRPKWATRQRWIRCCGLYWRMNAARNKEGIPSLTLPQMEKKIKNLGLN